MNYVPYVPREIKTKRYLFHVSHPSSRMGIERKGLLISKNKTGTVPEGVYAHNIITRPDYHWYPFVLFDEYEFGPIENNPLKYYDFWRIDTYKIPNKWFVDQALHSDLQHLNEDFYKNIYVYTNERVPAEALTLFRLQNDQCWDFEGTKGAYHYRGLGEFRPYIE